MRKDQFIDAMDTLKSSSANFKKLVDYTSHLLTHDPASIDTEGLVEELTARANGVTNCVKAVNEAYNAEPPPEDATFEFDNEDNDGGESSDDDDVPTGDDENDGSEETTEEEAA